MQYTAYHKTSDDESVTQRRCDPKPRSSLKTEQSGCRAARSVALPVRQRHRNKHRTCCDDYADVRTGKATDLNLQKMYARAFIWGTEAKHFKIPMRKYSYELENTSGGHHKFSNLHQRLSIFYTRVEPLKM